MSTTTTPTTSGACPSFFKAMCFEASLGVASYSTAGYELARHLATLAPDDCAPGEWSDRLLSLAMLARRRAEDAVLDWFDSSLPRCMARVSPGGRASFVKGVLRMAEADPTAFSL